MTRTTTMRDYIVIAWITEFGGGRTVELKMREQNAKEAERAARKAGWHDIMAVRRAPVSESHLHSDMNVGADA